MEQLGYLIARNVAPFRDRVHPSLIAAELKAVRVPERGLASIHLSLSQRLDAEC